MADIAKITLKGESEAKNFIDEALRGDIAYEELSTTVSKTGGYVAGDHLIYLGQYYEVVADIAQGGTIVTSGAGQNVEEREVGDEIKKIVAQNQTLTSAFTNNVNQNGCKNICPYELTNYSLTGITITDSADGNYKILNGTCSGNPLIISLLDKVTPYPIDFTTFSNITLATPEQLGIDVTKKYVFSRQSYDSVRFSIYLFNGGTQVDEIALLYDSSINSIEVDFSTYTFDKMFICAKVGKNVVLSNYALKPMLCLKSDWDLDNTWAVPSKTNHQLTKETTGLIDNQEANGAVNFHQVLNTSQVINGITWTVNDDGTVVADGTATADSLFKTQSKSAGTSYYDEGMMKAIAGKTIRFSGCPKNGSSSTYLLRLYIANDGGSQDDFGDGYNRTISSNFPNLNFSVECMVRSGQTVSNLVFKVMISVPSLNLGYDDYVPYAKSNKELTDYVSAIGTVKYINLTINSDLATDGTITVSAMHVGSGKWLMKVPQLHLKSGINISNQIANHVDLITLPSGYRVLDVSAAAFYYVNDNSSLGYLQLRYRWSANGLQLYSIDTDMNDYVEARTGGDVFITTITACVTIAEV